MERFEKLKTLLKDDPKDSFLQHALALEYIKEDKDMEARELFESILEREPSYIGSYYHLAKLLERNCELIIALQWYEKGMDAAKTAGDNKAYHELQTAYVELKDE